MNRRWLAAMGTGLVFLAIGGWAALGGQDDPAPKVEAKPQEKAQAKARPGGDPFGGIDLVKGLKETPGCLGVEAARTQSGKNVIFAWFKDKESVIAWFESDAHQKAMFSFSNGPSDREPLAEVPDGTGPILVVASITFSDKPSVPGVRLPISQISMELYQPLPGGVAVGGRFAPDEVKVPALRDYAPKKGDTPSAPESKKED